MEHIITSVKLSGLSCGACQKIIEKRLQKLSEVMSVEVSLEKSTAVITAMRAISLPEVTEALKDTDFKVIGLADPAENI